jgi:CHASE1-domain containing sensor protein
MITGSPQKKIQKNAIFQKLRPKTGMCMFVTLLLMTLFAVSTVWVVDQLKRHIDLQSLADDVGNFLDEREAS